MHDDALAIQQLYPQVFHACHVRHPRRRSNAFRLSERDGSILAHLGPDHRPTAGELARHMSLGAPTISAALARLERLGLIERTAAADRRRRELALTDEGRRAVGAASVLDPDRLDQLLRRLTPRERRAAVQGLACLARGARRLAGLEAA